MPKLRLRRLHLWAVLHATLLSFVTLWVLNLSLSVGDEALFMKLASWTKRLVLRLDDKPARDEFLFINIAYNIQLVPQRGPDGDSLGSIPVTDRSNLAQVFRLLSHPASKHRYALCDILFKDSSAQHHIDDSLAAAIRRAPRVVFPYHRDASGRPDRSFMPVNDALADADRAEDMFLKFDYIGISDSMVSLPLYLYQQINGQNPTHSFGPFYTHKGHLWLRSFIPELRVRNYDLLRAPDSLRYPMVYLKDLIQVQQLAGDSTALDYFNNKIVIIGDFEHLDVHKTLFGDMGGTLILLNAYLSLVNGDNQVPYLYLLLMWVVYVYVSVRLLREHKRGHTLVVRIYKNIIGKFLLRVVAILLRVYLTITGTLDDLLSVKVVTKSALLEDVSRIQIARLLIGRADLMLLLLGYFLVANFLFGMPVNIALLFFYLILFDFLLRYLRGLKQKPTASTAA